MQPASFALRLLDAFFITTPAKILHEAEGSLPLQKGHPPSFLLEAPVENTNLMVQRFTAFHRHTSLSNILLHGLIDIMTGFGCSICIGVVLVALRTVLAKPRIEALAQDDPQFLKKAQYIFSHPTPLVDGIANTTALVIGGIISLPLQIARTQLRHQTWRGWRKLLPSMSGDLSPALYLCSIANFCCITGNTKLRLVAYDRLGRPFAHPAQALSALASKEAEDERWLMELPSEEGEATHEDKQKGEGEGERKEGKGKEKVEEKEDRNGEEEDKGGEDTEKEEKKEEEKQKPAEVEDTRGLKELVSYHVTVRAIALGTTAAIGILHLPLLTVMHRLMLTPGEGISHCIRSVWEAEGWRGFYRGAGWYLLIYSDLLFPPISALD